MIACEWNPASVEALNNNLILNKCKEKCEILEGDNRLTCPINVADRVNLGLIPSSEESWPTAVNALKLDTGGVLHIHGNVDIKKNNENKKIPKIDWIEWSDYVKEKIKDLLQKRSELNNKSKVEWQVTVDHIEYVKSYGPRVDHLVLDVQCRPICI